MPVITTDCCCRSGNTELPGCHFNLARARRDGCISTLLDINWIGAGAKERKACVGGVDFDFFGGTHGTEADIQRPC